MKKLYEVGRMSSCDFFRKLVFPLTRLTLELVNLNWPSMGRVLICCATPRNEGVVHTTRQGLHLQRTALHMESIFYDFGYLCLGILGIIQTDEVRRLWGRESRMVKRERCEPRFRQNQDNAKGKISSLRDQPTE